MGHQAAISVGRTFQKIQGTPRQKRLYALPMINGCPDCISQPATYVNFDSNFNTEHLMALVGARVGGHWLNVVTGRLERWWSCLEVSIM
jgi:hypothetical protein